ncbi:BMP family ABC transporter substrate-binding protein [Nocardioides terrisoli]|uniref:BMP family ABC transporter substrate-binding protein n=1 Tax=Nocardioides terrisoli TaxID=3388267 RepID=UPI00287BC77E|nr:BMP family ABC transporter substrate-binding protein [Nocardioides marmorisolisilvae]
MRRKTSAVVALSVAITMGLSGCGSTSGTKGTSSGANSHDSTSSGQLRIGLALNGPINDKGFNQGYYDGLEAAAKKYDGKISVVQNLKTPAQQQTGFANLAKSNDLVLLSSGEFSDVGAQIAKQYPKVEFVGSQPPASKDVPANFHYYGINFASSAFLIGAISAKLSKTGTVAFVGGPQDPPSTQAKAGFTAGAKYAVPGIKVQSSFAGSYADPAAASSAAAAEFANGADVVDAFLDSGWTGVLQAAKSSGKDVKVFTGSLRSCTGGGVGFADENYSALVEFQVKSFVNKSLPAGGKQIGLEDGIQTVGLCSSIANEAAYVKELTAKVNSSAVIVPTS